MYLGLNIFRFMTWSASNFWARRGSREAESGDLAWNYVQAGGRGVNKLVDQMDTRSYEE